MTFLAALLPLLVGVGGWAQVQLTAELGWQGIPVARAVNPLWVTVENRSPSVLSGTLRAVGEAGSGWRGRVTQGLRALLLLPPGGRARLLFPWPVEVGGEPLRISVEAEGRELVRISLPVRAALEKPLALVGVGGDLPGGPAAFLAPEDFPADPILLDPFRAVRVAVPLPARARETLRAWAAFGGGAVEGVLAPPSLPPLGEEPLRALLRDRARQERPTLLLLALSAAYLALLGYALAALGRGRPAPAAGLLAPFLAFSLFYPVLFESPPLVTAVQISVNDESVVGFGLDTLAIVARRGGIVALPGHWVERRQAGLENVYSEILWEWGREGTQTLVRMNPGKTLILYRYGEPWAGEGGVPLGVGPVAEALGPLLGQGGRWVVAEAHRRERGEAWWVYRVRGVGDG